MSLALAAALTLVLGAEAMRFGVVSDDFRFHSVDSLELARTRSGAVVQGSFDEDVKPTGWATLRVRIPPKTQKKNSH